VIHAELELVAAARVLATGQRAVRPPRGVVLGVHGVVPDARRHVWQRVGVGAQDIVQQRILLVVVAGVQLKATFESDPSCFSFKRCNQRPKGGFNTGFDTVKLHRPTSMGGGMLSLGSRVVLRPHSSLRRREAWPHGIHRFF